MKESKSRQEVLKRTMPKKSSKIVEAVKETKTALDKLKEMDYFERTKEKLRLMKIPADKIISDFDAVNHPPHYKSGGIETIDFIEAKDLNYRLGNVIKYVSRVGRKGDPLEDLKKAKWYLDREIAVRERA